MNINNLFVIMKNKNISASKLSTDTGISTGNISDWKSGRATPSASKLVVLADYLDCSVDYLLGRSNYNDVSSAEKSDLNTFDFGTLNEQESEFLNKFMKLSEPQKNEFSKIASDFIDLLAEKETQK